MTASFHLVETWEEAEEYIEWLRTPREFLACDTETSGLAWWSERLRLVQFGDTTAGWAIPWEKWPGLVHETFKRHRGDVVFHNAAFDVHFLREAGVHVPMHVIHDTMLLSYLHDSTTSNGLKETTKRLLGVSSVAGERALKDLMRKSKMSWATIPVTVPEYWQYAALDTVLTARLFERLNEFVSSPVYDLELGVLQIKIAMERRGCQIDEAYVSRAHAELATKLEQVLDDVHHRYGDVNVFSNTQMIKVLRSEGVTLTKRTDRGQLALDEEVLLAVDHPLARLILDARSAKKIMVTYFEKLTNPARPSINQIGAAKTGRMSVTNPPLQTLPRGTIVRDAFIPSEDHALVMADYDQIELRLMAHFAQEKEMIKAIWDGVDLHTRTAQLAYGLGDEEPSRDQRQVAKGANFAKIFGAGIPTFAGSAGISISAAERFLAAYDRAFPGVKRFQNEIGRIAAGRAVDGVAWVETASGRKQRCDLDMTYKLTNYLIQGTAADVLKWKMLELDAVGLGEYMILPVHDELVFDVPLDVLDDVVHTIEEVMPETTRFSVPLSVGVEIARERWGDAYRG